MVCAGCNKTIQLDKRNGARYYPHFWAKHKKICVGVAEGTVSDLNSQSSTTDCIDEIGYAQTAARYREREAGHFSE